MAETLQDRLQKLRKDAGEVESQMSLLASELDMARRSFDEAKKFIADNFPQAQQAVEDIKKYKETSQSANQDGQTAIVQLKESIAALTEAEDHILGVKDSDGIRKDGLRSTLVDGLQQIRDQQDSQKAEFENLKNKIENLLPGATSAGLAEAYKKQKDSYKWNGFFWPFVFIAAVGTIVAMGFASFQEVSAAPTLDSALTKILGRLPFYLAAVWLASFASKRQSQNKRLREEYAHKESVSRSLEGYKREIQALENSEDAMKELMAAVVAMLSFNPSETLDRHHGNDKSPFAALIENWAVGRSSRKSSSVSE